MDKTKLKPYPFCGSEKIKMYASGIGSSCHIECECGVSIELDVPFGGMDEEAHDKVCAKKLTKAWNSRVGGLCETD